MKFDDIHPSARRRFPRRPFLDRIGILYRGQYHLIKAQEIGEGGMGFSSPAIADLKAGENVLVNFFLLRKDFISVKAELLYITDEVNQVGVRFLNLAFENRRTIRDYVALHK